MTAEWNSRLSAPIYIPLFVLFALQAVLGGAFSRLGYARRILIAALAALLVRALGVTVDALSEATPALNILQWLVPTVPAWLAARALFRGSRTTVAAKASAAPLGRTAGLQPLGA